MCVGRSEHHDFRRTRTSMRSARGFSLLEIVVVVGLISVLVTFAAYALNKQRPGQQLRSSAKELAAELRFTKSQAMMTGQAQVFQINANTREWTGPKNHSGVLPKSLEIIATTAKREQPDDGIAAIKFFPDGAATGGRIVLQHDKAKWQVDVKWLTGEVKVTKPGSLP
ncbi:MAG: type II secretion system protein XpsH [Arenimonas sp.]